ncbi:FAD-binding oxidoreductase [Bailinhaonella thermotolerans]|uniref:FAD-binding oxidoreductase n=1 Tax=Bailinhaonella thermotolerans TaxID=1070861 RepID=A0A3A4ARH5_9ACTN|nr:FAD-binding oxidoreductase [Bailinhaonella thermotolerans]RJL30995.1 FAD-binding oxidoreductase [Bailinhaonella thermotolerans]
MLDTRIRDFAGEIHRPLTPGYEALRRPWNLRLDAHPALVAEAADAEDVRRAVLAARERDLPFAVQSTGHGTLVPCDGGLLLRTGRLASVEVDPARAIARVGPGATWADVLAAAEPYGLAPISGTGSVGVTGYTLGGGAGWLSRLYGYAADSVVSAEVVTADGRRLTASPDENPDLFWALRGGSGSFGVVTSLAFRLYPVRWVYAGLAMYPVERAADVLARYREWAPAEPDELSTAVLLMRMPDSPQVPEPLRGRPVLGIRVFHVGTEEAAQRWLAPLLEVAGPPLAPGFAEMTFGEASLALGGPPHPPMAVRQHIDLFDDLPGGLTDALCAALGSGGPSVSAIEVRHWGGAMAKPGPDAGPAGHRDTPYSVIVSAVSGGPDGPEFAAVDGVAGAIAPYATGGSFLNFLTDTSRTRSAFTEANHARLARIKRDWDPGNRFRLNHNIVPA